MYLSVIFAEGWRRVIWDQLAPCSPWVYHRGSGKILVYISLLGFPRPQRGMTIFGWLWTVSRSQPISYLWRPFIGHSTMRSCISVGFLACIRYPGLLFLIVVPSLLHASGSSYTQPSVLSSFVVRLTILRRTVRQRVNQILEDMLRACVLSYSKKWDEYLPLAEFSYNNSYQESIKMAPFEALYGRRCRTSLNWS